METDIKTGIEKPATSDHFPIFLISNTTKTNKYSTETFIKRQYINSENIQEFKYILSLGLGFCHQTTGYRFSIQPVFGIFSRPYD